MEFIDLKMEVREAVGPDIPQCQVHLKDIVYELFLNLLLNC
jgi:hypothetical protein